MKWIICLFATIMNSKTTKKSICKRKMKLKFKLNSTKKGHGHFNVSRVLSNVYLNTSRGEFDVVWTGRFRINYVHVRSGISPIVDTVHGALLAEYFRGLGVLIKLETCIPCNVGQRGLQSFWSPCVLVTSF